MPRTPAALVLLAAACILIDGPAFADDAHPWECDAQPQNTVHDDVAVLTSWAGTPWTMEAFLADLSLEDAYGTPEPDTEATIALSLILSSLSPDVEDHFELAVPTTVQLVGEHTMAQLTSEEQVLVVLAVNAALGVDLEAELNDFEEVGTELGILLPEATPHAVAAATPWWVSELLGIAVGLVFDWADEECATQAINRRKACEDKVKACKRDGGRPTKPYDWQDYDSDRQVTFAATDGEYYSNDCNYYCWVGCWFPEGEHWVYNGQDGKQTEY